MFIRRTTYTLAPAHNSTVGQAEFEASLKRSMGSIDGLISSAHVPLDDKTWMVAAVYHSERHAEAAARHVRSVWAEHRQYLAAPEVVEHFGMQISDVP